MADNVVANAGSGGATFATDEIIGGPTGDAQWPFTKLAWGALNTATIVDSGASAVPIQDGGNSITVDGPLTNSELRATHVPISITDGTNTVATIATGPSLNVNLRTINGATPSTNTGTVGAGVQRVTLATDVALPSGNNNIGDVDVASVPAPLSTTGGGLEATALRVTVASDSTGVLSVDDNGTTLSIDDGAGSITVDGTVSVSGTVTVDTELPAAETPADALTNATATPRIGAFNYGYNGTTWDRLRSDTVNGLDVDVTRLPALVAGTANIGDVDVLTVPAPLSTTGGGTEATAHRVTIANDSTGVLSVDDNGASLTVDGTVTANLAAGTNNIGDVDVLSVVPGTAATNLGKAEDVAHTTGDTGVYALAVRDDAPAAHSGTDGDYESLHVNAEGGLWNTPTPSASGGLTIFRSLDIDETEEEIKGTAGTLYGCWFTNTATATRWLKFYNATAASVVVGTTTPVITIGLPGNTSDDISGYLGAAGSMGVAFATAMTVACTTGLADADTGAPGANDVVINVFYK